MRDSDLPLFAWQPPCTVVAFPMKNRIGKIRDVASKLLDKHTERHADYYCRQVTDSLIAQFNRAGIPAEQQDEQIGAFWMKVDQEAARLRYRGTGNDPRGAA